MDKETIGKLEMAMESIHREYGCYFELNNILGNEITIEYTQRMQKCTNYELSGGIFRILESEFEKRGFVLSKITLPEANTMHISFWYNPKFVDEDE